MASLPTWASLCMTTTRHASNAIKAVRLFFAWGISDEVLEPPEGVR